MCWHQGIPPELKGVDGLGVYELMRCVCANYHRRVIVHLIKSRHVYAFLNRSGRAEDDLLLC